MSPSRLRHLRASHADCACHERSAAICSKLGASAIPSVPATGMIRLRRCWPASMRSKGRPTFSIAHGVRVVGMRKRPGCLPDGSMLTAKKSSALHLPQARGANTDPRLDLTRATRRRRIPRHCYSLFRRSGHSPARRGTESWKPRFRTLLGDAGVLAREGGERAFDHPTMGLLHYQQVSLSLAGWSDYRLTMLLAAPTIRNR